MSATNWTFQNLLHVCTGYPNALKTIVLHGFLTGIAIGPEDVEDDPILSTAYGFTAIDQIDHYIELSELIWDAIDEIKEDLSHYKFEAVLRMDDDNQKEPALWMEGFNKAVALDEKAWEALNVEFPKAARKFVFIQSFTGADFAHRTLGIPSEEYTDYLTKSLPLFSISLTSLYSNYWGIPFGLPIKSLKDTPDFKLEDLPTFSPEELQQQSDEELLYNILHHSDLLPREVADEAIRRGPPISRLLRQHLEEPVNWSEDVYEDDWWGMLHAIFILGSITGEDATQGLLHAIERMNTEQDNDLWDWVGGYWPALFRNKRDEAAEQLNKIATDRNLYWYPRSAAIDCLIEAAHAAGPDTLDAMLSRIAGTVADETDNWDFRLIASQYLLDFPRDNHRTILEELAVAQEEREPYPHFKMEDVDDTYVLREDRLQWEQFNDPLKFYAPKSILSRQIRWVEEDRIPMDEETIFEDSDDSGYNYTPPTTYVREVLKVGRNDPCPCGSGKKYKKCCLKKLH